MRWEFEPGHTSAEFRCRHMMVTWVRGHIKNVTGSIDFDPDDPAGSTAEARLEAGALWSGENDRDDHLRSADFLDVETHGEITFRGAVSEVLSPTEFVLSGDLTIRGTTRPQSLDVVYHGAWETPWWEDGEDKGPMLRAGFSASGSFNRHDFGVSWNSSLDRGGVVVADLVHVDIDVEAYRPLRQK